MSAPLIYQFLMAMNEYGASDLYLTVGYPPCLRVQNQMRPVSGDPLTGTQIREFIDVILTSRQRREFETKLELNSSLDMGVHGRFRVNVMMQRMNPALVIRRIISEIPTFAQLRLPHIIERLADIKNGLVLVTGATGAGKSSTLASMIDYRSTNTEGHIITIEDPIEYFHEHKRSIVTQREVGVDTTSYAAALKSALRQRPDVILVGEIRDREVCEQALAAAETGHLCLSTMHTTNAYQGIERMVNLFPEELSEQIRMTLSHTLRAIVSQRLLPCARGGQIVALEVMLNEGLVKELIMKGDIIKIRDVLALNNAKGMCTFDQSILNLYMQGLITEETAISQADQAPEMKLKIQQFNLGDADQEGLRGLDTSLLTMSD